MSYSFQVRAVNKQEAKDEVFTKLTEVCEQQPIHKSDAARAFAAAVAFIDLIEDDDSRDVVVTMNGSIWSSEKGIQQASVSVNANLADKI